MQRRKDDHVTLAALLNKEVKEVKKKFGMVVVVKEHVSEYYYYNHYSLS